MGIPDPSNAYVHSPHSNNNVIPYALVCQGVEIPDSPEVRVRGIRRTHKLGYWLGEDRAGQLAHQIAIPVIVARAFAFGIAQSRHREAYEGSLAANAGPVHVSALGILVHGDNHFIVRGPLPDRATALALVRHWSLIQIGATVPPELQGFRISTREFREDLEWAVEVAGAGERSAAVERLLRELAARGIAIRQDDSGSDHP